MSLLFFLEVRSDQPVRLSDTDLSNISVRARTLPTLLGLRLFTPLEGGHDPFLKDEHPPGLVILAEVNGKDCLGKLLNSTELEKLIAMLGKLGDSIELTQEAMSLDPYQSNETKPGQADVSYLVNYQRPAEDENTFLEYYRTHHPQILLKFPAIRRVELGLPIEWSPHPEIHHANRMLYCEVSFDSLDALNNSLQSETRAELRKDYEHFPPFSGSVTHFAMQRREIL